jgi:hypothetical protein
MDNKKETVTTSHKIPFTTQSNSGGTITTTLYDPNDTTYSAGIAPSAPSKELKIWPIFSAALIGLFFLNLATAIIVSWVWQ